MQKLWVSSYTPRSWRQTPLYALYNPKRMLACWLFYIIPATISHTHSAASQVDSRMFYKYIKSCSHLRTFVLAAPLASKFLPRHFWHLFSTRFLSVPWAEVTEDSLPDQHKDHLVLIYSYILSLFYFPSIIFHSLIIFKSVYLPFDCNLMVSTRIVSYFCFPVPKSICDA